jgi:hypothetical protein
MLLAAAASLQAFGSEGDKYCPQLPKGSGYMWEWVFHVDSGYCIGRVAKSKEIAFEYGITTLYEVVPPGFFEPESAFVQSGNVEGTPVR